MSNKIKDNDCLHMDVKGYHHRLYTPNRLDMWLAALDDELNRTYYSVCDGDGTGAQPARSLKIEREKPCPS